MYIAKIQCVALDVIIQTHLAHMITGGAIVSSVVVLLFMLVILVVAIAFVTRIRHDDAVDKGNLRGFGGLVQLS